MSTLRERDVVAATNGRTGKQCELPQRIAAITEMIEQHRATMLLLERERMQLTTKLRLSGNHFSTSEFPE